MLQNSRKIFLFISHNAQLKPSNPYLILHRCCHLKSLTPTLPPNKPNKNVAIFWDLDNKPPKSSSPYDAATKLKTAAASFGFVGYMVAYANRQSFSYVSQAVVRERIESYICGVCDRKFYSYEKLVNHFKQIHQTEHQKRLNKIESARGKKRVNLVAKHAMKMQKYKNAAREILNPSLGFGLADEVKRAGFWVRNVMNEPQSANLALRDHMVDVMEKRRVECLVLVSDNSCLVDVLKEAKLRCVNTVVVGDVNDGDLKRAADVGFSWEEILRGKAKKEAISVVGRWKDHDILKRLEWKYDPEEEKDLCGLVDEFYDCQCMEKDDSESVNEDVDGIFDDGGSNDCMQVEDADASS